MGGTAYFRNWGVGIKRPGPNLYSSLGICIREAEDKFLMISLKQQTENLAMANNRHPVLDKLCVCIQNDNVYMESVHVLYKQMH